MTKSPGISLYNQDRFGDEDFVANFVARHAQVEALLNNLRHIARGGPTEHHILVGVRGMGKTSLLRRIAVGVIEDQELHAAFIPLRFREEQYNIISLDGFWRNCGESLAEYCEQQGNQALADGLDLAIETADWRDADKARDAFFAACREAGGRPILLLDNLDLILEGVKTDGSWSLRNALQRNDGPIVIGAATQLLTQGADRSQPFYEFFNPLMLEPLSEHELLACLNALANLRGDAGAPVKVMLAREPERIRALYVLTGGNPRILAIIYQLLEQADTKTIFTDLEALLDQVTPFYKARIEEYQTPLQRAVIDGIALNWDPITSGVLSSETGIEPTTLSAQLSRLRKAGLIEEVDTSSARAGFQLAERFLNIWYLMRHGTRKTKQRLRWFTMFLAKLYSADELQKMAGEARDGGRGRWHPDHCEAVIAAYEIKQRSEAAKGVEETGSTQFHTGEPVDGEHPEEEIAAYDALVARLGTSEALEDQASVALALFSKGFRLGALGRSSDGIAAYDELVERFGASEIVRVQAMVAIALINKGVRLGMLDRLADESSAYEEVVNRFGASDLPILQEQVARAQIYQAISLSALDRHEAAIAVYDEVITDFGESKAPGLQEQVANALINKGVQLGIVDRAEDAIAVYDEVIARFGESEVPDLQEQVGHALINKGIRFGLLDRPSDAIAAYAEVVTRFGASKEGGLQKQVARALANKASWFGKIDRLVDAIEVYDEIVTRLGASDAPDLQTQLANALLYKGIALGKLGQPDDAIAIFEDVVTRFGASEEPSLQEQVARALVNKGFELGALDRHDEEIAIYDDVLTRFGTNDAPDLGESIAMALVQKGTRLVERGLTEEAMAAYNASLRSSGSLSSKFLLAAADAAKTAIGKLLFWFLDKREEGVQSVLEAIDIGHDGATAKANLLWMYFATDQKVEAKALLNELETITGSGKSLMLAGIDLVEENLGSSLTHLADALARGLSDSERDYFEDLLWYLRIAAERGHGERLIEWFGESGNSDRYGPVYGAFVARVRGERFLLDLNPEVRSVAQPLYDTLLGGGQAERGKAVKKQRKRKPRA